MSKIHCLQHGLHAGKTFAHLHLYPPSAAGGGRGVEGHGIYPFVLGQEEGTLVMELLRNDEDGVGTIHIFGTYDGVDGAESLPVKFHDAVWHTLANQCSPHLLGLVELFRAVGAADDQPTELPCLIQFDGGIDAAEEELVGIAAASYGGSAQQQGDGFGRCFAHISVHASFCGICYGYVATDDDYQACSNQDKKDP